MGEDVIEAKFHALEKDGHHAVIVEVPLLQPIPDVQYSVAGLCVKAGIDIIQIPIPIRFPWMYGERIQKIQLQARENDILYKQSFEVLAGLIKRYPDSEFMPVGFYGGLQRMGQNNYISKCAELGIKIVDVPDYPVCHDHDPFGFVSELHKHNIDYVTCISTDLALSAPGSKEYLHFCQVVSASHGFLFLLASAGGKTGEKASFDYESLAKAKEKIREVQKIIQSDCPIVAVCGISTPEQVRILTKEIGLHVMFGSALFSRMMKGDDNRSIYEFLESMKNAAN